MTRYEQYLEDRRKEQRRESWRMAFFFVLLFAFLGVKLLASLVGV